MAKLDFLGPNIQRLRLAAGLTQAEAAARLGVALSTWARWEQSAILPDTHRLADIAKTLNTDIPTLFEAEGEPAKHGQKTKKKR